MVEVTSLFGPLYGYYPNATKTHLIVKPQLYDSAKQLFQDTANHVMVSFILVQLLGHGYLPKNMYPKRLRHAWSDEILILYSIAETHPHSAYCAFIHSLVPK